MVPLHQYGKNLRAWLCVPAALRLPLLLGVFTAAFLATSANAEPITSIHRNTFGEIGMLDMPNARMAPDGELALTGGGFDAGQRFGVSFQILPYLDGSFRYSRVGGLGKVRRYDYDRSFGLKLRLFQETKYTPDISVGIRDILGTGVYGAEYIVATKRVGDFDATIGLGWGRLSGNGTIQNPFGHIAGSFYARTPHTGKGGKVDFGLFFHGPDAGLFGGIVWHTPIDDLNILAEYSSDKYSLESSGGTTNIRMPWNFGVSYKPTAGVQVTAGWFYGSSFGATLTFFLDAKEPSTLPKLGPKPIEPKIRSPKEQSDALALYIDGPLARQFLAPQVEQSPQVQTYLPPNQAIDKPASVESLADAIPASANAEVYGTSLLVNAHARGHADAMCRHLADLAANLAFATVSVLDVDAVNGRTAICAVPHDNHAQTAHVIPASLNLSDRVERFAASPDTVDAIQPQANEQPQKFADNIRNAASAEFIRVEAVTSALSTLTIYFTNRRYDTTDSAVGRLLRIAMTFAPNNIEEFHFIPLLSGMPTQDIRIQRSSMERVFATRATIIEAPLAISVRPAPLDHPALTAAQSTTYPRFHWSVAPAVRQGLFDPQQPVRLQLYAALNAGVDLLPGLSVDAQYQANIYGTFSNALPSQSLLPHVRTDIAKYLTKGRFGISRLNITYRRRLAPDLYAEFKGGYLEDMYAGIGGQILWRPEGSRWALGADVYQVWKRDFNRLFGTQKYQVVTGHVSAYYRSPWHGINFAIHAGRYLAKDYGATFEISRTFMTNIEVGAFATFTNVPFLKFGEGSFDKGIFIRIPFDNLLPFSTQSDYSIMLRSLTRDGGQRLYQDDSLYDETQRTSFLEIQRHESKLTGP